MSDAGRKLGLSLPRRMVNDFLHLSQKVPTVTIGRRLKVPDVIAARQAASPRPGWSVLLSKAWAIVAARHPELRRDYLSFPWPHLYEHARSVAAVAVARLWRDEPGVFLATIRGPETESLSALHQRLADFRDQPMESLREFRHALRLGRTPGPLRRLLQWYAYNGSGRLRARHVGTFGVSSLNMEDTDTLRPLSIWTTMLHFGVPEKNGDFYVRLTFDHRVLDGMVTAWALHELERTLKREIVGELQAMRVRGSAA
jgi:hypothetical protein